VNKKKTHLRQRCLIREGIRRKQELQLWNGMLSSLAVLFIAKRNFKFQKLKVYKMFYEESVIMVLSLDIKIMIRARDKYEYAGRKGN
jgi:hypothetical protein